MISCLQYGLPVDSSLFVTQETEQQILEAIKLCGYQRLTPIKESLPNEISYAAIRYVIVKYKLRK